MHRWSRIWSVAMVFAFALAAAFWFYARAPGSRVGVVWLLLGFTILWLAGMGWLRQAGFSGPREKSVRAIADRSQIPLDDVISEWSMVMAMPWLTYVGRRSYEGGKGRARVDVVVLEDSLLVGPTSQGAKLPYWRIRRRGAPAGTVAGVDHDDVVEAVIVQDDAVSIAFTTEGRNVIVELQLLQAWQIDVIVGCMAPGRVDHIPLLAAG